MGISEIDLCTILGNLLENAFYGCEKTENPIITLKSTMTSPGIIALTIGNPFGNSLKWKKGKLISTRHKGPGLGLESVYNIVQKYNGRFIINYDNGYFLVKILLKF